MKVLLRIAVPALLTTLGGCASDPYSIRPQTSMLMQPAECEHTRRIVGQPCRVITNKADIRRMLGRGGLR